MARDTIFGRGRDTRPRGPDGKPQLKFKKTDKKGPQSEEDLRAESLKELSKQDLDFAKGLVRRFGTKKQKDRIERLGTGNSRHFIGTLVGYRSQFEELDRKLRFETMGDEGIAYRINREGKSLFDRAYMEGEAEYAREHGAIRGNFTLPGDE